ncbi:MAG: hypothetical protein SchgKO_17420 [Schleiferiaceae bacterium]
MSRSLAKIIKTRNGNSSNSKEGSNGFMARPMDFVNKHKLVLGFLGIPTLLLGLALFIPEGESIRLPHQTTFAVKEANELYFKNTRTPHYTFEERGLWGSTLFYPKEWEEMPILLMINLQWRTDEASLLFITSESQAPVDIGIGDSIHPFDPINSRDYHQKMAFILYEAIQNKSHVSIANKVLSQAQKNKMSEVLKDYLRLVDKVP